MRIAILANSQGTSSGVELHESYPALLRSRLSPADDVHLQLMSGFHVADFGVHYENVLLVEPDLVVAQFGIVECARRILSEREKAFFRVVPRGAAITRRLHDRRARVIEWRARLGIDARLYTVDEFRAAVARFVRRVRDGGSELLLLEIPCFDPAYAAEHFPLVNDDVELFNAVLREFDAVPLFRADDDILTIWQPGTVHLTPQGHRLAAERLLERVEAVRAVAQPATRAGSA